MDRGSVCCTREPSGSCSNAQTWGEWDRTPPKGTFYEQDVQRVNVKDDDIFRIEKIVKRKGNKM